MFKSVYGKLVKVGKQVVAGAVAVAVPVISFGTTSFDTTDTTAALTDGLTAVSAIGVATLTFVAIVGVWMKLRRPAR